MAMTDEDKKFTAWHEAGHALVNVLLEHTIRCTKSPSFRAARPWVPPCPCPKRTF
jgi:Zn-dependent peptidase ImmA (M78 family)